METDATHLCRAINLNVAKVKDERGASAVEYGLLVAGIAAMLVSAVFLFGDTMNSLLGDSCGTITAWVVDENSNC